MSSRRHIFHATDISRFTFDKDGLPITCPEVPRTRGRQIEIYDLEWNGYIYNYGADRTLYLRYPVGGDTSYYSIQIKTNRNALTYLWDRKAYPTFDELGFLTRSVLKQWRVNAHQRYGAGPSHRRALQKSEARKGIATWYNIDGSVFATARIGCLADIRYGIGPSHRGNFNFLLDKEEPPKKENTMEFQYLPSQELKAKGYLDILFLADAHRIDRSRAVDWDTLTTLGMMDDIRVPENGHRLFLPPSHEKAFVAFFTEQEKRIETSRISARGIRSRLTRNYRYKLERARAKGFDLPIPLNDADKAAYLDIMGKPYNPPSYETPITAPEIKIQQAEEYEIAVRWERRKQWVNGYITNRDQSTQWLLRGEGRRPDVVITPRGELRIFQDPDQKKIKINGVLTHGWQHKRRNFYETFASTREREMMQEN